MVDSEWREKSSEKVIVEWRGEIYIGSLQRVAPEFSDEIVFLSKSFYPRANFEDVLRKAEEVISLYADDSLNLSGRYHLLRRQGDELTILTVEQKEYMSKIISRIYELMVDDDVLG
jgi:hypothetical protein